MSGATHRQRQAFIALIIAALLLVSGLAVTLFQGEQVAFRVPPETLTPRLVSAPGTVAEFTVTTAENSFQLRRTLEGWALASHNGYEADAELAERLLAAIIALDPLGERTRLANGHERLSLGDPAEGGGATHIVITDNNDRELANLLIGTARQDGHVYVRRSSEAQSWLARGYLPEFSDVTQWMQLEFLSLGRSAIREACILPEDGTGYCLQRRPLSDDAFDLVSPRGWALVSPGAGDGVATVLARLRFQQIRPVRELRGAPVAEHRVTTASGMEVTLALYEDDDRYWARIVAVAYSDAARQEAIALNERTDGWAFELSDLALDRLIRPLSRIAVSESGGDNP